MNVFTVLDKFSQISGLALNKSKTQVVCLNCDIPNLPNIGISWVKDSFKTLGIWFSTDVNIRSKLNFSGCLKNINTVLNMWKQRDLSLKGKITILKTLIVPKFIYPCSMLFVPDWFVSAANKALFNFLWDGKPSKIKKSTIIGNIEDGGLKMPHVESIIKSLKLAWLSKLFNDNIHGRWKTLSKLLLGVTIEELDSKINPARLPYDLGPFHEQILEIWFSTYTVEPETDTDILFEKLWRNTFILVNEKPVLYKVWEQRNINRVQDLINGDNGTFLNQMELSEKYSIDIDVMMYNSLVSAIPRQWKNIIKSMPKPIIYQSALDEGEPPGVPKLRVRGNNVPITTLRTRDFYNLFI
jgi:hypothetical protein